MGGGGGGGFVPRSSEKAKEFQFTIFDIVFSMPWLHELKSSFTAIDTDIKLISRTFF